MTRHVVCLVSFALALPTFADDSTMPPQAKPQWQRLLKGNDAARAKELDEQVVAAQKANRYDEAIRLEEELLKLRTRAQGADHWETVKEKWQLEAQRRIAALPAQQRTKWQKAMQDYTDAKAFEAKGLYAKGEPLLRESLNISRELLGEKHPSVAAAYTNVAANLNAQGRYTEAEPLCRKALEIHRELLGEKHPHTAAGYNSVAYNLNVQGKFPAATAPYERALDIRREVLGENEPNTIISYNNLGMNLLAQAKYAEAEPMLRKALAANRELLGDSHRTTATSCNNLAGCLHEQGKYSEVGPLYEEALRIRVQLLGEKHPETLQTYRNIAGNLSDQRRYADADSLFRKVLGLYREVLGEKHPLTANAYGALAANLDHLDKSDEAQPLHARSLELYLAVLGEKHPDTAAAYKSLGTNLNKQGKYAEAQPLFEKALALSRELMGERHPLTALCYYSLASNLEKQSQYSEAGLLFDKALKLFLEVHGEKHPNTARLYTNVASNLVAQRKYAEAEPLCERALELHRELFGEKHQDTALCYNTLAYNLYSQAKYEEAQPVLEHALELQLELGGDINADTATKYNNLGICLDRQGKYAEAQPLLEKALAIRLKLRGQAHLETVTSYTNLADDLTAQRRFDDALPILEKGVACYEAARLNIGAGGFDRAQFGTTWSPYLMLATALLIHEEPARAWTAVEADLARGLGDEAAVRSGKVLPPGDRKRRTAITTRLAEIDPLIIHLVSKQSLAGVEQGQLDKLRLERKQLEGDLIALAVAASRREIASLEDVQAALRGDAALITWAGIRQDRWGCVVRQDGNAAWERLPGSGTAGEWTDDDANLPQQLVEALRTRTSVTEISKLARRLYVQRLAPLEKHLNGVAHLLIVPVQSMSGVPVELLVDRYAISYVPSGSFLARLKSKPHTKDGPLLALGDPVFKEIPADAPLPPGGLLVNQVLPGGVGARASLKPGDVLLAYGGDEFNSYDQFVKLIGQHSGDKTIPLRYWREGQTAEIDVPSGKLGVALDMELAPRALAAKRDADRTLELAVRGGEWRELPGTAAELARLASLTGDDALFLTRASANKQKLEELRESGKLAQFRYLHFATHGEANDDRAFESSLILTQDDAADRAAGAGQYGHGRLTAKEVLEKWKLDNAELVTLSACESALGRQAGGDGLLGFAQAFLLAGARSVCLSLWKVDDTATALLMDRFYQNLLGKRDGLLQPMGKAAALAEAKQWLRNLSRDEATKLTRAITSGVVRGNNEPALKLVVPVAEPDSPADDDDRPFSHPRYWAAFILIGDPD